MYLLIPDLINLLTALAPAGLIAPLVVGICKIVNAYFQRNKDKCIQMKKSKKGEIDITFTGYSMKEVTSISKDGSLKKIIVEAERKPLRLVKPKKSE